MAWVPYAGFDPIFWAHHAQVDRLIQIWAAANLKWETLEPDLKPFWRFQETYWQPGEIVDPDATFNYLYTGVTSAVKIAPVVPIPPDIPIIETAPISQAALIAQAAPIWSVHASAKKFELRGSFTVFVFLGKVPSNSRDWLTDPRFAGVFSVFANSSPESCGNCRNQDDLVVSSHVYLDNSLKAAGVKSLKVEEVTSFLSAEVRSEKVNLNWSVSTADGRILRSEDLLTHFSSLQIKIVQKVAGAVPIDGGYKTHPDITRGRPGGYRDKK